MRRKSGTYLDDTLDHVLNEGLAGLDLTLLLVLTEPHAEANKVASFLGSLLLHDLHLNAHVGEVLGD